MALNYSQRHGDVSHYICISGYQLTPALHLSFEYTDIKLNNNVFRYSVWDRLFVWVISR